MITAGGGITPLRADFCRSKTYHAEALSTPPLTWAPHDMPQSLLLGRVRSAIRLRPYSIRTEDAYVNAIRRFIIYHRKRYP